MLRSNTFSTVRRLLCKTTTTTAAARIRNARDVHATRLASHGYSKSEVDESTAVCVTFIDREGEEHDIKAPVGKTVLEVAHANDIDLEGACEGSLACSTCHVYIDEANFDNIQQACDDENDMLDLAFGLSEL